MNKFEKVSYTEFEKAMSNTGFTVQEIKNIYEAIKLPKRATRGSAGYDFFAPTSFILEAGSTAKIPTGIRVMLDTDKFLAVYPRSGLGFKYRFQLDNTVGIIDNDYYYSDNEGHIFIKVTNDSKDNKAVSVKEGEAFAQGIITQFFTTYDDETEGIRNGGFGSTSVT